MAPPQSEAFMSSATPQPGNSEANDVLLRHLTLLIDTREYPKTICPSEVARALTVDERREAGVADWRELMPGIRSMCSDLRDQGQVEILQRGSILPGDTRLEDIKGPIRVRKAPQT